MKATINNSDSLYSYLNKTGAHYEVDKNPSEEKMNRIREAIQRKNELFTKALERFSTKKNIQVELK